MFKAGDTAIDFIKEMHPHMSEETHKICVIGHAAGAAVCPTTLGKGYKVDVETSTPLGELKDIGFKSLHLCCTRIAEEMSLFKSLLVCLLI